jgi:hypothetical protein
MFDEEAQKAKKQKPNEEENKKTEKVNQHEGSKPLSESRAEKINEEISSRYGEHIIKLDTSGLFNENNWNGLKKLLKASINHDDSRNVSELNLAEKRHIILILEKYKIEFLVKVGDDFTTLKPNSIKCSSEENSLFLSEISDEESEAVGSPLYVQDDDLNYFDLAATSVQLVSYLYYPTVKIALLDNDSVKCSKFKEFHELVHLLDDLCVVGEDSSSGIGLNKKLIEMEAFRDEPNIKEVTKNILKDVLGLVIKAVMDNDHDLANNYSELIDSRPDGIGFGATEILSFILQGQLMEKDLKLNELATDQLKILQGIVGNFTKTIREHEKTRDINDLINLAEELSINLSAVVDSRPQASCSSSSLEQLAKNENELGI